MIKKLTFLTIITLFNIMFYCNFVLAQTTWTYSINNKDMVNIQKTSAVVDTAKNEIRLPTTSKLISFWEDDSLDYIVLGKDNEGNNAVIHYSFDGTTMIENPITTIRNLNSPMAAVTSSPYPDVVTAEINPSTNKIDINHYSFAGNEMIKNPALSVLGFTSVITISSRETDIAVLSNEEGIKHYGFDGTNMSQLPFLSIPKGKLDNPIDFALVPNSYNTAVLEGDRIKYFMFDGYEMIPALTISGLINAHAIAVNENAIAVIEGNKVNRYLFTGSEFAKVEVLSITSSLSMPSAIALRSNSYDMIVADGNEVKYFMFDGNSMVYSPSLSAIVQGLQEGSTYVPYAVVESIIFETPRSYSHARIRANHILEEGTSVTWSLSADGGNNFVKSYMVEMLENGSTLCKITEDNGVSWVPIGTAIKSSPSETVTELWTKLPVAGDKLVWKAELRTSNNSKTPRIKPNIVLDVNNPPIAPTIILPGECFLTTTPTIEWIFNDPDLPNDYQTAYEVIIRGRNNGTEVLNTGKIMSSQGQFTIPTSEQPHIPGSLWSSGDYQFNIEIKVYDKEGLNSEWSIGHFCIRAFERPRVKEIVVPPDNYNSPNPLDPTTHHLIKKGDTYLDLPITKAGGKVVLEIDSVGWVGETINSKFLYNVGGEIIEATIENNTTKLIGSHGITNRRWEVAFWTKAGAEECPSGTVVGMRIQGNNTIFEALGLEIPNIGDSLFGSRYPGRYSDGIIRIQDTVFEEWTVILQGRKKD